MGSKLVLVIFIYYVTQILTNKEVFGAHHHQTTKDKVLSQSETYKNHESRKFRKFGNYTTEQSINFDDDESDKSRQLHSSSNIDSIYKPKIFPTTLLNPSSGHGQYSSGHIKRSGIGIEKGPPDLQFGLAFTVPFISFSTSKLLSGIQSHRGIESLWDLFSLLKLNVGGLVLAAAAGVGALLLIPLLFPGKLSYLAQSLFGGGGYGALAHGGFGGFFPGFLEQLMPGWGLTKPLGYGQTYDHTTYPYHSDNYGAYSQRAENESKGKSRSLNDTTSEFSNFISSVFNKVKTTAQEYQTCALYELCTHGKNITSQNFKETKNPSKSGRNNDKNSPNISNLEHVIELVKNFGLPSESGAGAAISSFEKAFNYGKEGKDCGKSFKKCSFSLDEINKMAKSFGNYVFT